MIDPFHVLQMLYNPFRNIIIKKLVFADWNLDHMLEKHGVTQNEVELALADKNAIIVSAKHKRLMVLGRSSSRLLAVIIKKQSRHTYFVVTARNMSKKRKTTISYTERST